MKTSMINITYRYNHPSLKPIFHSDAKFLALGVGVGQYPRRQNFALAIPTCWLLGANSNPLICVLPGAKPKICVLPDVKPKRKPVEYRLHWVQTQNSGVGHVHFMIFVLILFAFGSQFEPSFQWNMGLKVHECVRPRRNIQSKA